MNFLWSELAIQLYGMVSTTDMVKELLSCARIQLVSYRMVSSRYGGMVSSMVWYGTIPPYLCEDWGAVDVLENTNARAQINCNTNVYDLIFESPRKTQTSQLLCSKNRLSKGLNRVCKRMTSKNYESSLTPALLCSADTFERPEWSIVSTT